MANVNITIDGVVYSVPAGPPYISVQSLINQTLGSTPSTSFGIDRHSLTVLTDTGGTPPAYQDVKNNTVEGHVLLNIRGGEVYASSTGVSGGPGVTKQ
jgi:hypothetical protein